MADYFSAFLGGLLGEGNQFKDAKHATRMYVDRLYALAPKQGFLYYVVFDLNEAALSDKSRWTAVKRREVGLLVKACELPKFSVATEVLNQYNRKTYVQTKITYNPINITFHDDHSNTTNGLWQNYYTYYYADGAQKASGVTSNQFEIPPGFSDTKYEKNESVFQHTEFGLNNGQNKPFFNSITVYQINRRKFTSYTLVNPIITDWQHDSLDQSTNNKLLENKMTVGYEAVIYSQGKAKKDKPKGFAKAHYDNTPSPMSILGGAEATLGTVAAGIEQFFGSDDDEDNLFLKTARTANLLLAIKNLAKNPANLANEAMALVTDGLDNIVNGANIPFDIGAGAAIIGGGAALILSNNSGSNNNNNSPGSNNTAPATSSNVTTPSTSQVSQSDVPTNSASNGQNIQPQTLPETLPTDAADLVSLLNQEYQTLTAQQAELVRCQDLKNYFDKKLATAEDDDAIEAINQEKISKGYTDPAKLEEVISKLTADITTVYTAYSTSQANLNSPATVSVDVVEIAPSPDATYNVSSNPDYQIANNTNSSAGQNNWTKETYTPYP